MIGNLDLGYWKDYNPANDEKWREESKKRQELRVKTACAEILLQLAAGGKKVGQLFDAIEKCDKMVGESAVRTAFWVLISQHEINMDKDHFVTLSNEI